MAVGILVKQETSGNPDGRADKSEDSGKCREVLVLLGDEESHISGDRQLWNLQCHRNDDAQDRATHDNRRSDLASPRWCQFAFDPANPIRIKRSRFDKRLAHGDYFSGGSLMIATADAPMRKRS